MYEQSAAWNEYYRELEPAHRRKLFDELQMTLSDDGANAYRQMLFERRYVDEKKPGQYVDRFLFQCVNLVQLYRTAKLFARRSKRELEEICRGMLLAEAEDFGPAGEKALYWEMRNTAARYFYSCTAPDYGRSLFGFMKSGDVNRAERMCQDAWQMSEGVSGRFGMTEQMRIWNQAVKDAFLAAEPTGEKLWEKVVIEKRSQ